MKKILAVLFALTLALALSIPAMADTENVLMDPSFEDGIFDNWVSYNNCLMEATDDAHDGQVAVFVSERQSHVDVPMQDITERLNYKGPGLYDVSAWVKLDEAFDEMPIQIVVQLQTDSQTWPTTAFVTIKGGEWTKLEGTLDLNWTGELTYAEFYFNTTPEGGNMSEAPDTQFTLDECSLIKQGDATAFPAATEKPAATEAPTATPAPTPTEAPTATIAPTAQVTATPAVTATQGTEANSGLSAGAVIGIIAAVVVLGGGAAFFMLKKKGVPPTE